MLLPLVLMYVGWKKPSGTVYVLNAWLVPPIPEALAVAHGSGAVALVGGRWVGTSSVEDAGPLLELGMPALAGLGG